MSYQFEIARDGDQVVVCLGNNRNEGFNGAGADLATALQDLARDLQSEPRAHELPARHQLRRELNALVDGHYSSSDSSQTFHVAAPDSWIPLSHSPTGTLRPIRVDKAEQGVETAIYVQNDGEKATTFKCVRYSPTREQWFQEVSRDQSTVNAVGPQGTVLV